MLKVTGERVFGGSAPEQHLSAAKINCLRPRHHQQPNLCQLSVPGMGLIVVCCKNNGKRRRRTLSTVQTVEHTLLDLSFIQELLGFRQSSKIHCSSRSGLFTQPGLGQIRSWARNVRRMMRQSLIAADPIHSNIY